MDPKFKIAYWLTDKKKSKLKIDQIEQLLNHDGYQLIRITRPEDFESKGPFSVFFHKVTDLTVNFNISKQRQQQQTDDNLNKISNYNTIDRDAENWIEKYEDYIKQYPWTRVLDPLNRIENLLDRNRQYRLVVKRQKDEEDFFLPNFIELTTKDKEKNIQLLRENNVKYPIVCKPLIAHGCTLAHQMSLVFSEKGLDDIRVPCVAQTFINHSCKLYKLFVLKNQYFIVERPSLKNHEAGDQYPTIHFESHQISKMHSACELNAMSKETELRLKNRELNREVLDKIVDSMRKCFDLTFFGIDVIIEDETGKYVVIDINNFPAYDGVADFPLLFKSILIEESQTAMFLRKSSLSDQIGDSSALNSLNQVVTTSLYSRIRQWFLTIKQKS